MAIMRPRRPTSRGLTAGRDCDMLKQQSQASHKEVSA